MTGIELGEEAIAQHPALNPPIFADPGREGLRMYHRPPTTTIAVENGDEARDLAVSWRLPDPRTVTSLQRSDVVELGAVAIASLLLLAYTDLVITGVTRRGDRADYWLGKKLGDRMCLLEVSGTDEGDLVARRDEKIQQLRANPFAKRGYVAVCRFRGPSACLRFVE